MLSQFQFEFQCGFACGFEFDLVSEFELAFELAFEFELYNCALCTGECSRVLILVLQCTIMFMYYAV